MAKKAVAKREDPGLPASLAEDMMADAGAGFENVTTEDLAIPFLRIVQSTSPQLKSRDPEYIEDAREGDIVHTVTKQIWKGAKGVIVVPCAYTFHLIEWRPRESGGGFVAAYSRNDPNIPQTTRNDKGEEITHDGNILVPTGEHFCLVVHEDGTFEPVVIAMSSTQLKYSRKWNSLANGIQIPTKAGPKTAPMNSHRYLMVTKGESNEHGDWSSWSITLDRMLNNDEVALYHAANSFRDSVLSGKVQAKHQVIDGEPTEEESYREGGGSDEDIPM